MAQLIKRLPIGLVWLLLTNKVQIIGTRSPSQLVIDSLKLILEFKLQSLHHLLHFNDLSFAVQNWFYLLPTNFLIKGAHGALFVHFCFHTLVKFL